MYPNLGPCVLTTERIETLFPYSVLVGLTAAVASGGAELTVYNQNFALVKEPRELNLKKGVQQVVVEDVAQKIEANSVGIRSVSNPGSFSVLEQNYKYDLINAEAILQKVVGKRISMSRVMPNGMREKLSGVLMSAPTAAIANNGNTTYNGMVVRTDDGRIILNPTGEVEVNEIPSGMISKPSLVWTLDSESAGKNKIELSYLTTGMGWNADYILALDKDGKKGDLKGWVNLTNNSGTTYRDAKLKLLAGDVNRIRTEYFGSGGIRVPGDSSGANRANMQEEQFAEYHLYTVQRPVTVADKEFKQVSLLEAFDVPVEKRLIVDAMRNYRSLYGYRPGEGQVGTGNIKPLVLFEFVNDKESNLGMPFPAGKFKVFQRDSTGSLQMLGEDRIEHTARKERLSLVVGRAFDIVCERKRTKFEWINSRSGIRESFEIELRNRKDTAEKVYVYERQWLEWKIIEKSMDYETPDAHTVIFPVKLKPQEVKKVTYTVETYW